MISKATGDRLQAAARDEMRMHILMSNLAVACSPLPVAI
jgi:hypothetical protein